MSLCGTAKGFTRDCDYPLTQGTEQDLVIIDYELVKAELAEGTPGIVFDATVKSLLTDFTFKAASTRKGFSVECPKNTIRPSVASVMQNGINFFTHSVAFPIADNLAASDDFVTQWKDKKCVIIVKNSFVNEDGAGKYKIYGLGNGLILSAHALNAYENGASHMLTFTSDENSPEKFPVWSLFDTDEATTDAIYAALKVAA